MAGGKCEMHSGASELQLPFSFFFLFLFFWCVVFYFHCADACVHYHSGSSRRKASPSCTPCVVQGGACLRTFRSCRMCI